ncbi:MAG: hypothetical protein KatS3mg105_3900 [Gemmatales bacterium]|nr:MAG: hypothetical protein KatS3mg105_3900 [Gemmatales bacterium]
MAHQPEAGTLFNVNIPSFERGPVRGVPRRAAKTPLLSVKPFDRRVDPRGRTYFWIGPVYECDEPHPDSDVSCLYEGFVTVTPLRFNLTNADMLKNMRNWQWTL